MFNKEDVEGLHQPKVTHRVGGTIISPTHCNICDHPVDCGGEFSFVYITNTEAYMGFCQQCYKDLYINK